MNTLRVKDMVGVEKPPKPISHVQCRVEDYFDKAFDLGVLTPGGKLKFADFRDWVVKAVRCENEATKALEENESATRN